MIKRRALLAGFGAIALAGCDNGGGSRPAQQPAPPPSTGGGGDQVIIKKPDGGGAGAWAFWYSSGVPAAPAPEGQGWVFDAPRAPGSVNYLTIMGRRSLRDRIAIAGSIEQSADAQWSYRTNPDNTCDGVANFRLYVQRTGDDMTGRGPMASYRWWSNPGNVELKPGEYALDVKLDPALWSNVFGKRGNEVPAEFAAAIADVSQVGVTFGGGCFFGHGVQLLAGSARVHCSSFIAI